MACGSILLKYSSGRYGSCPRKILIITRRIRQRAMQKNSALSSIPVLQAHIGLMHRKIVYESMLVQCTKFKAKHSQFFNTTDIEYS